jgi:hypothetical protein
VTIASATGDHTWGDWEIVEYPTETTTGVKTRFCTVCAEIEDEIIPATGSEHVYDTEWTYDRTGHWHACTKSGHTDKNDFAAHDYNNHTGGVNGLGGCVICDYQCDHTTDGHTNAVKPTATQDTNGNWNYSSHTIKCSVCGMVEADEPHDWTDKDGNPTDICYKCGLDRTQHVHDFDDWVIDQDATTEAAGSKHRTCRVCGYTETAEIPKLDVLKLETPVLTDLSTNDTCKFSFNIDPRFANES